MTKLRYADPTLGNAARSRAIEAAEAARGGPAPVASEVPSVAYVESAETGYAELSRLADEIRRNHPFLSTAQAFERATRARPDLMLKDRSERYRRMGFGITDADVKAHDRFALG
jgi:hypothetical protein